MIFLLRGQGPTDIGVCLLLHSARGRISPPARWRSSSTRSLNTTGNTRSWRPRGCDLWLRVKLCRMRAN
jgi:hypothetical protein